MYSMLPQCSHRWLISSGNVKSDLAKQTGRVVCVRPSELEKRFLVCNFLRKDVNVAMRLIGSADNTVQQKWHCIIAHYPCG